MVIRDVHIESDLAGLNLRVLTRYGPNDSPSGVPRGPLDDLCRGKKKMVLICEDVFSDHIKMHIFLYGVWAEKLEFVKVANLIDLEGGCHLVHQRTPKAPKEIKYCICISDSVGEDEDDCTVEKRDTTVSVLLGVLLL